MNVTVSHHAQIRMQQRAITADMLESLLDFGQVKFNGQGTEILTFPKKVVKHLKKELNHKVFMKIERHLNLYAIMSSDGELITTGYRTKRLKGH
ncbi:hypothetical protein MCEMOHM34_00510 [Candidatus Methylopumilus universalis]|jgi:hypothetical protein|uniref:hypothetical protein n=1 Tax=Candidatus Methylopumilus TaxID=1679002 RepID=UPI00111E9663|nr:MULTISPECIES: hypothetical protein [Methylopumilus]QDD09405.1 hypothetical protein FIT65_02670 [Candidatus Methylopumilus planktonicus]QDD11875.1 hypothetical protein FIT62_01680 [Candidatus Methylopumilus rimovensis]